MFLEKTIESWLTRTSELGYTLPFCQVLLAQGHAVCHISRQNAFEQGKDIITVDAAGVANAYQLKSGNITDHRWHNEVMPEIVKLRSYPVIHPSIDRNAGHISWLVTTGNLEDTVRRAIDDLNTTQWRDAPLRTIVRGELLRDFVEASARFVPQELADYKYFLELFFSDGTGLVDEAKLSHLLEEILRFNEPDPNRAERKRNIASAVLYTSYVLSPFYSQNNHIACLQILTILYAHILGVAQCLSLPDDVWKPSVDLLDQEMARIGELLESEIVTDRFSTIANSWWDGELGVYRRQLAMNYLAAYKLSQLLLGVPKWSTVTSEAFLSLHKDAYLLWGEGAVSGSVVRFWLLSRLMPAEVKGLTEFMWAPLRDIALQNGRNGEIGFACPHHGITEVLRWALQLPDSAFEEDFTGHSYCAAALTHLLARYERRDVLAELWRELTYISNVEFKPDAPWQIFRWHNLTGLETARFQTQTKSWADLRREAEVIDDSLIPSLLKRRPHIAPFFLLAYPHRFTPDVVKLIDQCIVNAHIPSDH